MSVPVVDLLEPVDIGEEHAEDPSIALHLLVPGPQDDLSVSPVGKAGERIHVGHPFRFREPLQGRGLGRVVGKNLHSAHDPVLGVPDRRDPDRDGHTVAGPVMQVHFGAPVRAVCKRLTHGADALAQHVPLVVHVNENVVRAPLAHDLCGSISRDPLGALVPVGDHSLFVDEINAVVEVV